MSTYINLGSRSAIGVLDTTGNNSGNWTVTFAPEDIGINLPYFEVFKVIIHGAAGSTMDWFVDSKQWETTLTAKDNAWDPAQPLILNPGQYQYFYWSDPVTDLTPPTVTIWLRYDTDLEANQRASRT